MLITPFPECTDRVFRFRKRREDWTIIAVLKTPPLLLLPLIFQRSEKVAQLIYRFRKKCACSRPNHQQLYHVTVAQIFFYYYSDGVGSMVLQATASSLSRLTVVSRKRTLSKDDWGLRYLLPSLTLFWSTYTQGRVDSKNKLQPGDTANHSSKEWDCGISCCKSATSEIKLALLKTPQCPAKSHVILYICSLSFFLFLPYKGGTLLCFPASLHTAELYPSAVPLNETSFWSEKEE